MPILRRTVFAILLLSLCSCGFQMIYKDQRNNPDASYVDELAAIRIKKDRTRLSQELKNNLYDLLNPDYLKVEPKYFLSFTVAKTSSPTFITITGASGRNRVNLDVTYELSDLETGEKISSGSTSVNDNYDVTANRYGTYVAEEYIQGNLTIIAAQNLRNSLVNDFIEMHKERENKTTNTAKEKELKTKK